VKAFDNQNRNMKMSKRLSVKVGEYEAQDGTIKGEYVQIGVILENSNGEYVLLDPAVSLSGLLARQNHLEWLKGGQVRANVMCGIYEDEPKQAAQPAKQQTGYGNRKG
jgi:hypothetical protein